MAATAISPREGDQIKLGPAPQVFALRFTTGKDVMSKFPGGRVMFTAIDERKLFLNDEEANEFEHALLDQNIQPVDFIKVTRVTHGRGGGFSIRVERVPDESDAHAFFQCPREPAVRSPAGYRRRLHGRAPTAVSIP